MAINTGVVAGFSFRNITGDGTTVVSPGAGILHTVTFNNPTATEVVTIYDSVASSGTKVATITVPSSPQPVTLTFDAAVSNGITVVTATATSDITITFI